MPYQSPWMNDELRMFRKTVRRFVQEEFVPHQARWRQQHRPDAEAWTKAGAAGLLLTAVPEEYGGGGGTFAHEAVVVEEFAQAAVAGAAGALDHFRRDAVAEFAAPAPAFEPVFPTDGAFNRNAGDFQF